MFQASVVSIAALVHSNIVHTYFVESQLDK